MFPENSAWILPVHSQDDRNNDPYNCIAHIDMSAQILWLRCSAARDMMAVLNEFNDQGTLVDIQPRKYQLKTVPRRVEAIEVISSH